MIIQGQQMVFTGCEKKTSKKGTEYYLVRLLEENGEQISVMTDVDPNELGVLKKLESYVCDFELTLGRYMNLKLININ